MVRFNEMPLAVLIRTAGRIGTVSLMFHVIPERSPFDGISFFEHSSFPYRFLAALFPLVDHTIPDWGWTRCEVSFHERTGREFIRHTKEYEGQGRGRRSISFGVSRFIDLHREAYQCSVLDQGGAVIEPPRDPEAAVDSLYLQSQKPHVEMTTDARAGNRDSMLRLLTSVIERTLKLQSSSIIFTMGVEHERLLSEVVEHSGSGTGEVGRNVVMVDPLSSNTPGQIRASSGYSFSFEPESRWIIQEDIMDSPCPENVVFYYKLDEKQGVVTEFRIVDFVHGNTLSFSFLY